MRTSAVFSKALILMAFTMGMAQAQVTSEREMDSTSYSSEEASAIFFKVGPGFSTISESEGADARTGLFLGAEFDMKMSRYFSLVTGLDYIQKGISGEGVTLYMNYLEVPFMAQANMPVTDSNRFTLGAGPYIGYAIARGVSAEGLSRAAQNDVNKLIQDNTKSLDFGARFGVGFQSDINSSLSLGIGLNYDLGLANINKQGSQTVSNRAFLTTVGLGVKI